jgi:threonine synthase
MRGVCELCGEVLDRSVPNWDWTWTEDWQWKHRCKGAQEFIGNLKRVDVVHLKSERFESLIASGQVVGAGETDRSCLRCKQLTVRVPVSRCWRFVVGIAEPERYLCDGFLSEVEG